MTQGWMSLLQFTVASMGSSGSSEEKKLTLKQLHFLEGFSMIQLRSKPRTWAADIKHFNPTRVTRIVLSSCQISDRNIEAFTSRSYSQLKSLLLDRNAIDFKGLRILSASNLKGLETLKLDLNPLGVRGAKALVKLSMPNLLSLSLYGCFIQNEGLQHLVKSKWPHINKVQLRFNRLQPGHTLSLILNSWPLEFETSDHFYFEGVTRREHLMETNIHCHYMQSIYTLYLMMFRYFAQSAGDSLGRKCSKVPYKGAICKIGARRSCEQR